MSSTGLGYAAMPCPVHAPTDQKSTTSTCEDLADRKCTTAHIYRPVLTGRVLARYQLDPNIRKDPWTPEEDQRLLMAYQEHTDGLYAATRSGWGRGGRRFRNCFR
eukprot:2529186-Rhodomonas_salina.1